VSVCLSVTCSYTSQTVRFRLGETCFSAFKPERERERERQSHGTVKRKYELISCLLIICCGRRIRLITGNLTEMREHIVLPLVRLRLKFSGTYSYHTNDSSHRHFFTARRSYASAVLGVVTLSVCPSVIRVLCD